MRVISEADQRWSMDDVPEALEWAAAMWFRVNGDQFPESGYSTSENQFLRLAEQAFFRAQRSWREAHAPQQLDFNVNQVPSRGFWLYRLWGEDDRLLYVGVSTNLRRRLQEHHRRWGDLIKRVVWEEHESERAMLAAERKAITEEDPAFNVAGIGEPNAAHS